MILFFSGDTDAKNFPEAVLEPEKCVGAMLTYYDVQVKKSVRRRFDRLVCPGCVLHVVPTEQEDLGGKCR